MRRIVTSAFIVAACLCFALTSTCRAQNATPAPRSGHWSRSDTNSDFSDPATRILDVRPTRFREIKINLRLDKNVARPGDEISMSVETDTDCFLTILNVTASGKVVRLWPNSYSGLNNQVRAFTHIRIPARDSDFRIRVDGSQPVERILAYATTKKDAILEEADFDHRAGAALASFMGGEAELNQTFETRVERLPRSVKWGVAQTNVRVGRTLETERDSGLLPVIIEMRCPQKATKSLVMKRASRLSAKGFSLDENYDPVPMETEIEEMGGKSLSAEEEIVVVRGEVDENRVAALEREPDVIKVWRDDEILFYHRGCPERFKSCDCAPNEAKGTLADVVKYLGVDKIWEQGYKGKGVVIGIVDDGILAEGRHKGSGAKISGVIGGVPNDWGTKTEGHGMMTATDALGMTPEARLYDIRILGQYGAKRSSDTLRAFDWALRMYRRNKTPQILSNSWGPTATGIRDRRSYASNPKHALNRKIREAAKKGILILFAAGNCGETCPVRNCEEYTGPGKSIWAPCGLPEVMTVAAANLRGEWVGYSSQGPGLAEQRKPDFSAITHFKGFRDCDNGTSAACPVAAGVVALLKQANPKLTQKMAKELLMDTAKQIGPSGWNIYSGAGIIQPESAFKRMMGQL